MKLIQIENCSDCPYDLDGWCLFGDHAITPEDFLKSPNFPNSCTLPNAHSGDQYNGKDPMQAISTILKDHGVIA